MRDKLLQFLRKIVSPGDVLIAAVSGGMDSMAMLHCLLSLQQELSVSVSAAHYNHNLRGAESNRDADLVKTFCAEQGIPFFYGSGHVASYAAEHSMGIEEAARALRYAFLESLDPNAWILTAHNADDNLETLLMHLIRGAGLHGLTGILSRRDRILRPMLEISRAEIEAYVSACGIPYVEDSTNKSDQYFRNRIRHYVTPVLLAENPALLTNLQQMCDGLRADEDYLAQQAKLAQEAVIAGNALSCTGLLALHPALRVRVLTAFLSPISAVSSVHLRAALELCQTDRPSARLSLPGGCTLCRSYDQLTLLSPAPDRNPVPSVWIAPGQTIRFGPWEITCRHGPAPEDLRGLWAIPFSEAFPPLMVRTRQPGDRMTGPGGTRKLSDIMIDKKVPARWRDTMPVVCKDHRILAVLPVQAAFPRPEPGQDSLLLSAKRMEE